MLTALLAIAMGATIISGLVTIYYDIPRQMGKEFRSYGANMLVIPTNPDKKITNEQLDEIKSLIPSGKLVGRRVGKEKHCQRTQHESDERQKAGRHQPEPRVLAKGEQNTARKKHERANRTAEAEYLVQPIAHGRAPPRNAPYGQELR